jgi:CRISPR-associated protein Csm3
MKMNIVSIKEYKGKIKLETGLHIGSGDTELHIGGTDNPVIKHPHTLEPFIPGSSIKGKIRSLLELESGVLAKRKDNKNGNPLSINDLENHLDEAEKKKCINILKLFGVSGSESDKALDIGPTRASFSDCKINEEWLNKARENNYSLTEVKAENSIDRVRGTAQHPRFIERVPNGVEFDFRISIKIFEEDEALEETLLKGMKLLELDALGGSGSRGYGKISFELEDKELKAKMENIKF